MPLHTTLSRIRRHEPCPDGWRQLRRHLGTSYECGTEFPLLVVLDSNGLEDCLWALRAEPQHAALYRQFAVRQAGRAQAMFTDPSSTSALSAQARGDIDALARVDLNARRYKWAAHSADWLAWYATSFSDAAEAAITVALEAGRLLGTHVLAQIEADLRAMLTTNHAHTGEYYAHA